MKNKPILGAYGLAAFGPEKLPNEQKLKQLTRNNRKKSKHKPARNGRKHK